MAKDITFNFQWNRKQFEALTTPATEVLYGGAKGSGKAVSLDTPILTSHGWKCIEEVHTGDYVYGEDGKLTKVVAESEIFTNEDTYEVEFDNGEIITAGANHQWYTQTQKERVSNTKRTPEFRAKRRASRPSRSNGSCPWMIERNKKTSWKTDNSIRGSIRTTKEIADTIKTVQGYINHGIPIAKPIHGEDQTLPIHPYVLGAWLGDGCATSGQYTTIDSEIIAKFEEYGYSVSQQKKKISYTILGIKTILREYNLLGNKHIPEIYKNSSYSQRLELLRGLFDSDGSISKKGRFEISLSDKILATDMIEVLRSVGVKASLNKNKSYLYGERKKDRYRTSFSSNIQLFYLPRKAERVTSKVGASTKFWYIVNVRKVERQPLKCIEVDNSSHLFLVGKHLIPTHNSFLARNAAILYAMNIPGLQVYIFRESYSEVKRNYLYGATGLQEALKEYEEARLCTINASEPRIHFANGSDIYLRHMNNPQDVEQIRGNDVHFLIADEAAQWLLKDIYYQLRTCMRCTLNIDYEELAKIGMNFVQPEFFPRSLLLSNPGGPAHNFIKQEFIDSLEPNEIVQMPIEKGGMKRQFIPACLHDNKILVKTDPNYKAKLMGSGKHVRAMLEGDWSIPDGAALADVWSPRWNVMPRVEIPSGVQVKRCFDWGTAKPFAVTYVWETRNESIKLPNGDMRTFPLGTMIVVGELYGWNGSADEGCRKTAKDVGAMIKKYEIMQPWYKQITAGPSDGSIWNGTGMDKTINDEVIEGYNLYHDPDIPESKTYSANLFIPADKTKGSRHKGLVLVQSYLEGAHPIEVGGQFYPSEKQGLIFMSNCKHCIRTLPTIPYDKNDPDDIDTKSEDHIYDTIRYAVLGRTAHFERLDIKGL